MRNTTPAYEGWLSRNVQRLAFSAVLGLSACTPAQNAEPQKTHQISEAVRLDDQKAVELAKDAVKNRFENGFEKVGIAPRDIVKGDVSRIGDDNWELAFARATLNSTGEYPAARTARPEQTTVVYLTLASGAGIAVALNSATGEFISMDGDN